MEKIIASVVRYKVPVNLIIEIWEMYDNGYEVSNKSDFQTILILNDRIDENTLIME